MEFGGQEAARRGLKGRLDTHEVMTGSLAVDGRRGNGEGLGATGDGWGRIFMGDRRLGAAGLARGTAAGRVGRPASRDCQRRTASRPGTRTG